MGTKRSGIFFTAFILVTVGFTLSAMNALGGEKPKVYTIYQSHDLSGPMGPLQASVLPCFHDFTEWYNKTYGGIDGVPIEIVTRDNAGKVDAGIAAYEFFRNQTPKPAMITITPTFIALALKDRTAEDQIVNFLCGSSNKAMYPVQYNIGAVVSYPGACAATMNWVKENWKGGKVKVGFLTWDNTFGKGIFDPKLREWFAKQDGLELVGEEVFKAGAVDVTTQLVRLRNNGANWIYDNTLASGPVVISKGLDAMGLLSKDMKDTAPGKIHRATGPWGLDGSVIRLGGGPGGLMEGLVGIRHVASWAEKDAAGMKIIYEYLEKNDRGPEVRTITYIHYWAKMLAHCEVIRRTVEKYGWDGLTGPNVRQEMFNLKDFDALGLAEFTFTEDVPFMRKGRVFMVKDGFALPISGYVPLPSMKPDYANK